MARTDIAGSSVMGVGGELSASISSATCESCSLLTEKWAVAWANAGKRYTSFSSLPLACSSGKVKIFCLGELDREDETVIKITFGQVFHHGYGTSFKICWETTPPIWVRVMERLCIQNFFLPSLSLSRQKVCTGEVCAVCSAFSKTKLELWWSEKNSSNNRHLVTAKQTSLLWKEQTEQKLQKISGKTQPL